MMNQKKILSAANLVFVSAILLLKSAIEPAILF